jgi:hypothetical protein
MSLAKLFGSFNDHNTYYFVAARFVVVSSNNAIRVLHFFFCRLHLRPWLSRFWQKFQVKYAAITSSTTFRPERLNRLLLFNKRAKCQPLLLPPDRDS